MKVLKFNENINKDELKPNDLIVKIKFSGNDEVLLSSIKEYDAFTNYIRGENKTNYNYSEAKIEYDAIFYGIEAHIYHNGLGGFEFELEDINGNIIKDYKDYEKFKNLQDNVQTYNL